MSPGPLWAGYKPQPDYDIALRPDDPGGDPSVLDDIVVKNVKMFRAEAMSDRQWWCACYLDDEGDSIVFWADIHKGRLRVYVTALPDGDYTYERSGKPNG